MFWRTSCIFRTARSPRQATGTEIRVQLALIMKTFYGLTFMIESDTKPDLPVLFNKLYCSTLNLSSVDLKRLHISVGKTGHHLFSTWFSHKVFMKDETRASFIPFIHSSARPHWLRSAGGSIQRCVCAIFAARGGATVWMAGADCGARTRLQPDHQHPSRPDTGQTAGSNYGLGHLENWPQLQDFINFVTDVQEF